MLPSLRIHDAWVLLQPWHVKSHQNLMKEVFVVSSLSHGKNLEVTEKAVGKYEGNTDPGFSSK